MKSTSNFDAIVIGGGIFGCYAAHYLSKKGARVALLEKETRLFQKASLVNQARLHSGYHYPRSIATAALSDEHKARFTHEHRQFVNFQFEKFYAIERFGSFTDARQFERFCQFLNIRCERVAEHPMFNFERLEAVYRTEEYSFDPILIADYYTQLVENQENISIFKNIRLLEAGKIGQLWSLHFDWKEAAFSQQNLTAPIVINATYAASNAVNRLFGLHDIDLMHEISEIAFLTSQKFAEKGLTVMDGAFGSIMPYGKSGLLSLSSVAYTHHKVSYQNVPTFDCQQPDSDDNCTPTAPGVCTRCPRRPIPNATKMLAQMRHYFSESVDFQYLFSYFTIKSKLKSSYIDDGRPTEISMLHNAPKFYCLFAGKVNSIYEIEKIVGLLD